MKRKPKRRSRSRRSPQPAAGGRARPEVRYPIATVAYYGPDDRTVTKITVGIVEDESAEPIMERWIGPDVTTKPEVQVQIAGFIQAHGVQLTTHLTIENQIADENPKEVRRVIEALMRQGLSRHEAIHQVGRVLSEEIFHLLNDERPFDEAGYIRKLRRLVR
jgi:hypothetical protein